VLDAFLVLRRFHSADREWAMPNYFQAEPARFIS
jgi:hypothetical protein